MDTHLQALFNDTVAVSDSEIGALRGALRGSVLFPGEPGYDTARTIWNAMIDRQPGMIVRALGTADVIQAVNFAREDHAALAVRGGGHDIAGHAVCDGGSSSAMLSRASVEGARFVTTRRLAAIIAADVAGYSRLMHADEERTHAAFTAMMKDSVEPALTQHGGRLVKGTGDGFLAEFPSAVEAVRCALQFQDDIIRRTSGDPPEQRLVFRVGINLGDVIVEPHDIFGDGVNIAARLEALADPGGVLISAAVHEQVRGRVQCRFDDVGEQQVKNIPKPVRVYRVLRVPEPAPVLAARDKPSIAVLPFQNMSGDPEQEYFADGMSEEITTALSRIRWLFVIARNSAFTYKGRSVDLRQVGRELGVRYVLEGSVRKAASRVRITAQLAEAETGRHLWADRFDGNLSDVFELQDHVTEGVIRAVAPTLRLAEMDRVRRKPPESLDAYDLYLRALPNYYVMTREGIAEALGLLRRALVLDPGFAAASALAALFLECRSTQGWSDDLERDRIEAVRVARQAIASDPNDPDALAMAAQALAQLGHAYSEAAEIAERAITLSPNSAFVLNSCGWVNVYVGRPSEAISCFERAFRADPLDPMTFSNLAAMAMAHIELGQDQAAVAAAQRAVQQNPNYTSSWRALAAALALAERDAEAAEAAGRLLQLQPDFSLAVWSATAGFANATKRRYFDGMRRAGLPE